MATTTYTVFSWIFRIYVFFNLLTTLRDYPEHYIAIFLIFMTLSIVNDLICTWLGFEKWYMTDDTVSVLIVILLVEILPDIDFFSIVALWLVISMRIGYYRWLDAEMTKIKSKQKILKGLEELELKAKNQHQELREIGVEGREIREELEGLQAQFIRLRASSGNI